MNKKSKKDLYLSALLIAAFVLWTLAVTFVNVNAIGPNGSAVGFSSLNLYFHKLTKVNLSLYYITDWLGIVPILVAACFGALGVAQWIKRKKLSSVDYNIFILGGFYVTVIAVYILFEIVTINYRPVLIGGVLETSYPSSTTLLVISVMSTAIMQARCRIKNVTVKKLVSLLITLFIAFMVVGRIISGVHWITDIIGGILLSTGLVIMYRYFVKIKE